MKKFKKLIPAFCMLLISAVLMGTSTYAWFSMNRTVTANGMEVTAKSNASYLLIGSTSDAATNKTGLTTTATATKTGTTTSCYPVAFSKNGNTFGAEANQVNVPANGWYTASNGNSAEPADDVKNYKVVTEGDAEYMLTYKVWLTLSADSEPYTYGKIKVTLTANTGDVAVKAVVKIGNDYIELGAVDATGTTTVNANLTKDSATEVIVYVYVDGASDHVYSDYINANNTISGSLSLQFDLVDNAPAA